MFRFSTIEERPMSAALFIKGARSLWRAQLYSSALQLSFIYLFSQGQKQSIFIYNKIYFCRTLHPLGGGGPLTGASRLLEMVGRHMYEAE